MKKIVIGLALLCGVQMIVAKLLRRNSSHMQRMARSPYHHATEPCCNRRSYYMPETSAGAVSQVRQLRKKLWDQLDDGTYQDDWQWTQNRIREIETRLGYIVDWED